MILVDSSVWIDFFRGLITAQTNKLDSLLSRETTVIGDLILVEVLQGFSGESDFVRARDCLTSLIVVELVGLDIAVRAARNFRLLRKRGITIRKTINMLIATCCIQNGWTLLYADRDFDACVDHLGLRTVSCS